MRKMNDEILANFLSNFMVERINENDSNATIFEFREEDNLNSDFAINGFHIIPNCRIEVRSFAIDILFNNDVSMIVYIEDIREIKFSSADFGILLKMRD